MDLLVSFRDGDDRSEWMRAHERFWREYGYGFMHEGSDFID